MVCAVMSGVILWSEVSLCCQLPVYRTMGIYAMLTRDQTEKCDGFIGATSVRC